MRIIICVLAGLTPTFSFADEGEVNGLVTAGVEAGWLAHPSVAKDIAIERFGISPLLKISMSADLGFTNATQAGLAIDLRAATNVSTHGLGAGGLVGDVVTGTYFSASLPATLSWRADTGGDASFVARLGVGPTLNTWVASAFVDPSRLDSQKRPTPLPLPIDDAFVIGGVVTLSGNAQLRIEDFVFELGPSFSLGWAATPFATAGFSISAALVTRPLPQ